MPLASVSSSSSCVKFHPQKYVHDEQDNANREANIAALRGLLALPVREVDLAATIESLNIAFVDDGGDATDPTASAAKKAWASSRIHASNSGVW